MSEEERAKKHGATQKATTGFVFDSRIEQPRQIGLEKKHAQENGCFKIGSSNNRCHYSGRRGRGASGERTGHRVIGRRKEGRVIIAKTLQRLLKLAIAHVAQGEG